MLDTDDDKQVDLQTRAQRLAEKYPEVAAARDWGVDIPMLLANLDRPVAERIRRHQIALNTFRKLHNTGWR